MKSFKQTIVFSVLLAAGLSACDGRRDKMSGGDTATFAVDEISLKNKEVLKFDHDAGTQLISYQFRACMQDAIAYSSVKLTEFVVSDGHSERTVKTEPDGCLTWTEQHEIQQPVNEAMIRVQRHFRAVRGFKGKVTVDLAFNPTADGGTWYDLRKTDIQAAGPSFRNFTFNASVEAGAVNSGSGYSVEPFLSSASFEVIGQDQTKTRINRLLSISTVQKMRLSMDPKFITRNLNGQIVYNSLTGGSFRVKIAVLREGSESRPRITDLVAGYTGDIRVNDDGSVVEEIEMRIYDRALAQSRNTMVMILQPLGSAARRSGTGAYFGTVSALDGKDFDVKFLRRSAEERAAVRADVNEVLAQLDTPAPRAIDLLSREGKMAEDAAAAKLDPKKMNPYLATRTLRAYCDKLYRAEQKMTIPRLGGWLGNRETNALAECQSQPAAYVKVIEREMVESVTGEPVFRPDLVMEPKSIRISRSTTVSVDSDTSNGYELSLRGGLSADLSGGTEFGAPAGAKIGIGAKVGVGADAFVVKSYKQGASSSVSASTSQEQTLTVVSDAYEIPATVRRCVMVTSVLEDSPAGFFGCDDGTVEKKLQERYYLVNYSQQTSTITDDNSISSKRWRLSIRGEDSYNAFEKLVTRENTVLQFTKWFASPLEGAPLLPDFKMNQGFPGMVSPGSSVAR